MGSPPSGRSAPRKCIFATRWRRQQLNRGPAKSFNVEVCEHLAVPLPNAWAVGTFLLERPAVPCGSRAVEVPTVAWQSSHTVPYVPLIDQACLVLRIEYIELELLGDV